MALTQQLRMTLLLGSLVALAPFSTDLYLPSLPAIGRDLGASAAETQLTLSGYMLAWALAQLVAGPMSDRFGRRSTLAVALGVFVVASLVCTIALDIRTLIVARVVQGLAGATAVVVPRAAVRDMHGGDRAAQMLSSMMIVFAIAPVVAPMLGSLLQSAFGWRSNFVFLTVYGVVALVFVWFRMPETNRAPDPTALDARRMLRNFGRLLRSRNFVGYMAVAATTQAGLFAFIGAASFVFIDALDTSERTFALLFGTVMIGNVSGAVVARALVRRWGLDRMIQRGTAIGLIAGVAMAAGAALGLRHPAAIVAPMFVYMSVYMWTMPQATAGALTPFPEIAGSAASLLSFVQMSLAAMCALLVGLAFDATPRPMATGMAVMAALAFASFRLLVLRGKRSPTR